MLDKNTGREAEGSHNKMKFQFDALLREDGSPAEIVEFAPIRHWLVVSREAHSHESAGGGQGQNGPWPNNPNELAKQLDFAVIELNGSPGVDRGWYDISQSPWPRPETAIDLFQFPLGRAMTYLTEDLVAPTVFEDDTKPPRIEHLVNTEKGSSGGLCLDMASSAVALHQAGYKFANGVDSEGQPAEMATRNVAIPLAFIATVAGQMVKDRIANAPRVLRSTADGVPIVGRRKFQALVDMAIRGNIRILTVQTQLDEVTRLPQSKVGKSFSERILKTLLPDAGHVVFSISSARLTQDAHNAASLIVETIHPASKVPSAPTGQTSLDADTIGTLVTPVVDAMCAAAGNGMLWLAIDDLDRNPVLTESTTSTFLNALYKATAAQSRLRIVLIGPTKQLPGLNGLQAETDKLDHVTVDDVEAWIIGELGQRLPMLPQYSRLMADIARSVADELAKEPTMGKAGAVAHVLKTHWGPRLRATR